VEAACWAYLAAVALAAILMYALGDRWWLATPLLYGPRWVVAAPLAALLPMALVARRRALVPVALAGWLAVGPVLGLCVPWGAAWPGGAGPSDGLRVLTCNVRGAALDAPRLAAFVAETSPDVVLVQEWPSRLDLATICPGPGWHLQADGEFGIASRYPIVEYEAFRPRGGGSRSAVRYALATPAGRIDVVNLHPISVRDGLDPIARGSFAGIDAMRRNTRERWLESATTSRWAAAIRGPLVLAGDLNLPAESPIYRACWSGYRDAFAAAGLGFGHTWFSSWHGLRIDHVLAGAGWTVRGCRVGPDVGSDHRPVVAALQRAAGPQDH
jgi:endonuclease/exonuclease/phosphatase (EEP) superfamily protein YafD